MGAIESTVNPCLSVIESLHLSCKKPATITVEIMLMLYRSINCHHVRFPKTGLAFPEESVDLDQNQNIVELPGFLVANQPRLLF